MRLLPNEKRPFTITIHNTMTDDMQVQGEGNQQNQKGAEAATSADPPRIRMVDTSSCEIPLTNKMK
jgi:hypothetical protein